MQRSAPWYPLGPASEDTPTPRAAGWQPVSVREYEAYAKSVLPANAWSYYASGANDMITLVENRAAFSRLRLLPRILRDVSAVDTSTTVCGLRVSSPICIAPTAMQRMAHNDGEVATSRAAASANTLMTLSSWSTTSLEDVASAAPGAPRFFQLYVYKDREVTLDLIRRAEAAGYTALAVTVDTPVLGRREGDVRGRFALPPHLTMGNFANKGGAHSRGTQSSGEKGSGLASYVASLVDPTLDWSNIQWLRKNTSMRIVVKGVMTPEDALEAVRHGVDGIWVSNHGARQLDTVPATIEVLPAIVSAVGGRAEVYLDGGVIRGTDVIKALALGARAVFIGRPVVWGLAHSGEEGVKHVLKLMNDELVMALQLMGCTTVEHLRPSHVVHHNRLMARL